MDIELLYAPSHTLARVHLQAGESIRAESGAMAGMSQNVAITTDGPMAGGGFFKKLKRAVLSGETFFTNTFSASLMPAEVLLAPPLCGDLVVHTVTPDEDIIIQGANYVACPDSVQIDTQFQGFRRFFSGQSLFFLTAAGRGPVLLNGFGAIEILDLGEPHPDGRGRLVEGDELMLDTGHLVAMSTKLDYEVTTVKPGWLASYFSGEGFVLRVRGRGRLYVQTRNQDAFGREVGSALPAKKG
jgi:uncharacterized protein (TIGR00266 family)